MRERLWRGGTIPVILFGAVWAVSALAEPTQFAPRIINGLRAPEHRYPWIVLVQARDEVKKLTGICGGSIITRKHVLTAGHCLFLHGQRSRLSVLYGHTTLALAKRSAVVRAKLHPGYVDKTLLNDIAVLELSRELKFSDTVQPVCLPTEDFPPLPGTIGIVAGWGYTSDSGKQHRNPYLLFVTQTIKPQEYCRTVKRAEQKGNSAVPGTPAARAWPAPPMFLDDKNPQLFYGNCLQSVPSSLSRAEPPKPERPPFSPRGPVLRDRQR
ncbi:hypothetical protein MTO96_019319 [Rhipicephalus appendiculatus]